ncbi:TatD family hydrolase [Parachitinimonas caeni]|uniref:TatD family hydrolase n=1 Tax=Parachitinimonas caeni TaxID=3031301 RepID=A0ABT7DTV7_9NEIS|nr:TatD family hydrolase [Parachitinimonas caeni]MDK2123461.1 TatD family hydrolase [Parachitinimonas caeni]
MFIDSHCHIDFPELAEKIDALQDAMRANQVSHALCISVNLAGLPGVLDMAERFDNVFATVGVHPDYEDCEEPSVERLVALAKHPRVVGIGETGLDYYRLTGDLEWQRERFRVHIRAARQTGLPLIVHTRSSAEDTLRILEEEGAAEVGGVMHCFTENREVAAAAIALNFHISLSGIVTFKNAVELKEVARSIPLERMLIETDSPYLAPVPFRGKTNHPALVKHVAEHIADLRGVPLATIAEATTRNFIRLFKPPGLSQ